MGCLALGLAVLPLQMLVMGPLFNDHRILPDFTLKTCRKMLGVNVEFNDAALAKNKRTIFVANHMSYLDPIVVGSSVQGAFVGKAEAAKWPLIGQVGKAFRTVFIQRTREYLPKAHEDIVKTLDENGHNLILFPEGTTSDGAGVMQFKAGLFSVLFNEVANEGADLSPKVQEEVVVQPMALRVKSVDGKPVGDDQKMRDKYAWYGDENMLRHMWKMAAIKTMEVELTVLPALHPKDFKDHKELINKAHDAVKAVVAPHQKTFPTHLPQPPFN